MINIKRLTRKQVIAIVIILAVFIVAGVVIKILTGSAPKKVYEIAVFAHNQEASDPAEDLRSSMKIGDVLVIMPEGHNWSQTEMISYLILKIELTEEQAKKLVRADLRELDQGELSEEEKAMIEEEKRRAKAEDRKYVPAERREIVRPRLYRIRMEDKAFEGFSRERLLNGQPYMEKIFDWGIIEKKKSVK